MDRLRFAATVFNDPNIQNIYKTKFEVKQTKLKEKPKEISIKPESQKPPQKIQYDKHEHVIQNALKGTRHPPNFKACLYRQYNIPKQLGVKMPTKKREIKRETTIMQQIFSEEVKKATHVFKEVQEVDLNDGIQTIDKHQWSTNVNRNNPNIVRRIIDTKERMIKSAGFSLLQRNIPSNETVKFYARDIMPDSASPKTLSSRRKIRVSRQQQEFIMEKLENQQNKEIIVEPEQNMTLDSLNEQLNQKVAYVVTQLQQKLKFKTSQLMREVKQLQLSLKQQKSDLLDKISDLNKQIQELTLLNTQKDINAVMQKNSQTHLGLAIDVKALTNLQNYMLLLSAGQSLWLERGSLGCQGCLNYLGFKESQLQNNLQLLNTDNDQSLTQIADRLQQQFCNIQKSNSSSNRKPLDMEIVSQDQENQSSVSENITPDGQMFLQLQQGVLPEVERDLQFGSVSSRKLSELRTSMKRAPSIVDIHKNDKLFQLKPKEKRTVQQYDQGQKRYVIFPCGDSICEECNNKLSGFCPVCFGPIQRVVRAKRAAFCHDLVSGMAICESKLQILMEKIAQLINE